MTSIEEYSFGNCSFYPLYSYVNQFLSISNQQKNGLIILNSIVDNKTPKDEYETILRIISEFLFNENEEIRIESFKLMEKFLFIKSESNEFDEEISSLIIKYSELVFKFKKNNNELQNIIKLLSVILNNYQISLNLMCIIEKVEEMIDDREIPIDFRICCFSLIDNISNVDENILPKILQLTLEVCQNDRFNYDYFFGEKLFTDFCFNNLYTNYFFKDNIEILSKSKKLSDNQVALFLIKILFNVIPLIDCLKYIDLILKIGDCEDKQLIYCCILTFNDLIDNFNESLVIKFDQISKFLLKNFKFPDSLNALSKLIKGVHRSPIYFTNIIDSLLSLMNSQEKNIEKQLLKCINSCFSSGLTLISPFDKPFNLSLKVFETISEGMNSNKFEVPIVLKLFGNLVFSSPDLVKKNLDKIMKFCQCNLNGPYLCESSKCIRKIASYLPDSISPFLPEILQIMLDFISQVSHHIYGGDDDINDGYAKQIVKISQCLCQIGFENDEFGKKINYKYLWMIFTHNMGIFFSVFSKTAKFFGKKCFSFGGPLNYFSDNLCMPDNDILHYLKSIQHLIKFLPKEQISDSVLMNKIGNALLSAGTGFCINFFISDSIFIIPDKFYRKIFDCLIAYVDIYQKKLCSKIKSFMKYLEYDMDDETKLSCIQFSHFLAKLLMICRSEFNDNLIIDYVCKKILKSFQLIQDSKPIDSEKLTHILISMIYVLRIKRDLITVFKESADKFREFLIQFDSNDNFECKLACQTAILNFVMIYELPIDDDVKKILNEIKFIKNMEVLPLLAEYFIYIFKMIGDEILPLMKKFASVLFSSEKYILDLIDKETLQFYYKLMNSIKLEELILYTNLNESSIHQIDFNMKAFSS